MTRGGTIPALLLLCAGVCLAQSQPDPPSPYSNPWYLVIVVGFFAYVVFVIFFGRTAKPPPPAPPPIVSDNFGTASYAPPTTMLEADRELPAVWTGVFFG